MRLINFGFVGSTNSMNCANFKNCMYFTKYGGSLQEHVDAQYFKDGHGMLNKEDSKWPLFITTWSSHDSHDGTLGDASIISWKDIPGQKATQYGERNCSLRGRWRVAGSTRAKDTPGRNYGTIQESKNPDLIFMV